MIIKAIKDFFGECPLLAGGHIGVDYLPADAGEYVIEPLPCNPIVKKYVGGGTLRRYDFVFASRKEYSEEVRLLIANSGLFENITGWIEEQSKSEKLPELPEGCSAQWLEVTSGGYLFSDDGNNTAVYQMQCRLVYYQEG